MCDYHILKHYFYFLDYFIVDENCNNCIDREWYVNFCVSRINDILFEVLWYIDYAQRLKGETKDSCFRNAVKEVCEMEKKNETFILNI